MTTREARCACGQLRVRCAGEPVRISVCHCIACKQRTGSAFGVQARYLRDQVVVEGEANAFERAGDSGAIARFRFCPTCGVTVCWELDAVPGPPRSGAPPQCVAVAVGCFGDPRFPAPTVSVYEDRQCPWLVLGDSITERWA